MIPKIIHYCWFGNATKPDLVEKCLNSWKKYLPDYQIIEWNEKNVDIDNEISYVKEAYKEKKYAFVSDYIRLKALYQYGGIYFDTDYEVLKPIDDLLENEGIVTGFESSETLLTAFIAVGKENCIIKQFMEMYHNRHFYTEKGDFDLLSINDGFSKLLGEYGVNLNNPNFQQIDELITVYPVDVLCGFDMNNWHEKITDQTLGVHHMGASWVTKEGETYFKLIRFFQRIFGLRLYDFLKTKIYDQIKSKMGINIIRNIIFGKER